MNDVVSCTKALGLIQFESEMTAKNPVIAKVKPDPLHHDRCVWPLLCAFYVIFFALAGIRIFIYLIN
jgi:hypothetical protein